MRAGIGHNNGPSLDGGVAWRRHVWTKARAELIPNLPIEVLRRRVARARELGLPYKTYASVRASTGRDVIGFLFSNNALRVLRRGQTMPGDVAEKLRGLTDARRVCLAPEGYGGGLAGTPLDAILRAPPAHANWPDIRSGVLAAVRAAGGAADGVLVIGETMAERDWAEAGRTAGFLTGGVYFSAAGQSA